MQEYFYTKFSECILHIFPHKSVEFYSINLIFIAVVQHQSLCSIFANITAKGINGFRSVANPRSSTTLQIAVTEQPYKK